MAVRAIEKGSRRKMGSKTSYWTGDGLTLD
jgi:hypothetical protein